MGPLKDGEDIVADSGKMADILNNFFCSVFTREDISHLPAAENLFVGAEKLETVQIKPTTVTEKLKKWKPFSAPGPDRMWPRVLYSLADVLGPPLAVIYTRCLDEGSVPCVWKRANVTPIFKKGSKGSPGNYRPVSLTCVLCKVMES